MSDKALKIHYLGDETLTVRELKRIVRDLPEVDKNGDDYEVWIMTGCNESNPVNAVIPLCPDGYGSDVIFDCAKWYERGNGDE